MVDTRDVAAVGATVLTEPVHTRRRGRRYRRSGTDGYAAQVTDTVSGLTGQTPRTPEQLLAEQPAGPA
jgi:hypothetical protein